MDQLPGIPSNQPSLGAAPRVVPSPGPSGGLKAMGIVQIAFGALGMLGAPMTLGLRSLAHDAASRRVQEVMWTGTLGTWTRLSLGLSTVMALMLLVSGIGVLKLRPWARRLAVGYGLGATALLVVSQIMNAVLLVPALSEMARASHDPVARAGATGGIVGGIVGGLLGLTLPIAVLIVMTRPAVKAQFGDE
jgi:hypothetical protein